MGALGKAGHFGGYNKGFGGFGGFNRGFGGGFGGVSRSQTNVDVQVRVDNRGFGGKSFGGNRGFGGNYGFGGFGGGKGFGGNYGFGGKGFGGYGHLARAQHNAYNLGGFGHQSAWTSTKSSKYC